MAIVFLFALPIFNDISVDNGNMVDDSDIAFFLHPKGESVGIFRKIQPGAVVAVAIIGIKVILERLKGIGFDQRFKDDHVLGILPEAVGGIQGMTGGNSKFSRHL